MHAHCLPNTRTEVEETKRLKDEHNMNKASSCQQDPTRAFPGCSSRCIKLWERIILARSRCNNCCWSTPLLCSCGSQASKCFNDKIGSRKSFVKNISKANRYFKVERLFLLRPSEAPWLFDAPRLWPWWSAGLLPLASAAQGRGEQQMGQRTDGRSRTVKDGWVVQAMVATVGAVLGQMSLVLFLPASPRVCRDAPAPPLTHPHAWTLLCATSDMTQKNNPVNNRMDVHFSSKHKLKNASEW